MPFRKVDEVYRVQRAVEDDPSYKKHIDEANRQYELIKNLVNIRKELKLSQGDVARRSGLTQQMVSRIETFDNSPTLDVLMKYVVALGVDLKVDRSYSDEQLCALCY